MYCLICSIDSHCSYNHLVQACLPKITYIYYIILSAQFYYFIAKILFAKLLVSNYYIVHLNEQLVGKVLHGTPTSL